MMKSTLSTLLAAAFLCCSPFLLTAQSGDEGAITEVIYQDTKAFFSGDWETWQTGFAHVDYLYGVAAAASGPVRAQGWEAAKKLLQPAIEENGKKDVRSFSQENMTIRVNGNMALAFFDQTNPNGSQSWEHRVLEKIDGDWKIVSVVSVNASSWEE